MEKSGRGEKNEKTKKEKRKKEKKEGKRKGEGEKRKKEGKWGKLIKTWGKTGFSHISSPNTSKFPYFFPIMT